VDRAVTSILGRESVSTFYYAIEEIYHIPQEDFPKRPLVVLDYLEKILGKPGFAVIKNAIIIEIRRTFRIEQSQLDVEGTIEIARKNYIFEDISVRDQK
jgi:hypothetical protein